MLHFKLIVSVVIQIKLIHCHFLSSFLEETWPSEEHRGKHASCGWLTYHSVLKQNGKYVLLWHNSVDTAGCSFNLKGLIISCITVTVCLHLEEIDVIHTPWEAFWWFWDSFILNCGFVDPPTLITDSNTELQGGSPLLSLWVYHCLHSCLCLSTGWAESSDKADYT